VQRTEEAAFAEHVRQHARRVLTAAATLGLAFVFMLVGLTGGPTFLFSPMWRSLVVALLVVGATLVLCARKGGAALKAEAASLNVELREAQRRATPSRPRVAIWSVLLIGWLSCLVVVGSPALAAAQLGANPSRAVALQAEYYTPCSRCLPRGAAWIKTGTELVRVELRGVAQDPSYYKAGIVVIYKASDPSVAMALADYNDGNGSIPPIVAAASTSLFLLATWGLTHTRRRTVPDRR
jgi:hypothetical protein